MGTVFYRRSQILDLWRHSFHTQTDSSARSIDTLTFVSAESLLLFFLNCSDLDFSKRNCSFLKLHLWHCIKKKKKKTQKKPLQVVSNANPSNSKRYKISFPSGLNFLTKKNQTYNCSNGIMIIPCVVYLFLFTSSSDSALLSKLYPFFFRNFATCITVMPLVPLADLNWWSEVIFYLILLLNIYIYMVWTHYTVVGWSFLSCWWPSKPQSCSNKKRWEIIWDPFNLQFAKCKTHYLS